MIYDKIVEICKRKGRSINDLEKEAGLSSGSISKWNTSAPSVYSLYKVSKILKVKMEKLLEE